VATGKAVGKPLRHDGFVFSASISPDGKWVITTSSDQTARLWEAATGKLILSREDGSWSEEKNR
jgi:WD40 repeat protein